MKEFFVTLFRAVEKLGKRAFSKSVVRAPSSAEVHLRNELEAERLDRLRNPGNYRMR
jgi:hypothetical protein